MQSQSLGPPGAAREPPLPPLCLPSSLANGFILRPTPSSFLRVDRVVRGQGREMPWCLYGKHRVQGDQSSRWTHPGKRGDGAGV